MSTEPQHSPLPWARDGVIVIDANGHGLLCADYGSSRLEDEAIAEKTVRLVNSHKARVLALRLLVNQYRNRMGRSCALTATEIEELPEVKEAVAALTLAEKGAE